VTHPVLADSGFTLDGAWVAVVVIGFLFAWLSGIAIAISGTASALSYPSELWRQVGARRMLWVWQVACVFAFPLALVYSGFYFLRIRPRLVAATGQQAINEMAVYANYSPLATMPSDERSLVRIRIPVPAQLLSLLPTAVIIGMNVFFQLTSRHPSDLVPWAWIAVAGLVIVVFIGARVGVDLTPTHAVVRTLRSRSVPWADIAAVAHGTQGGSRRVFLWTTQGKRIPLRAPVAGFPYGGRKHYERDLHTIGQWWLDHRPAPG
jgi:hypothetical protein